MKLRMTNIISIIMLFAMILSLNAKDVTLEEVKKNLPKMLGANNVGREFYFSFIPCWETAGAKNDLKVYVSSGVRTKVVVDVPQRGYEKIKYTVPNDIIEFTLAPAIGQPYQMTAWVPPEPEKIWRGAGVHVKADDPIIVYGVTRYQYTSDGFLAVPVPALGKEYIIASFRDVASNSGQWLPSEFTVTAAYDKTKVLFTMGGNDWSKTVSGQLPEEMTSWNLNAGDVLMVSSLGQHADLSGSTIQASKPVGIISGNFCAYVPTNCGCCDVIEEMELPTNTWGTEYHVTKVVNRLKNSYIKIFAKEPKTNLYRDHLQMGFLRTAGGKEGPGYLDMRADEGTPRPIVISGDKPIGVTQFNTGQQDDGITSDPFQMILTPLEQYQKEIIFNTPGIRGGFGFSSNYLNLCYEATEYGTIPDDLEFASVEGGVFAWEKLMDKSPNPGEPFKKGADGKTYYSKTINLPGDGVYKLRSSRPFAAYAYGFSSYDSYGFPTSVALGDLTIVDTLPPEPEWMMDCSGNVNLDKARLVTDKPDPVENRSNLSTIYMHSDVSYNYKLYHGDFMPCEDQITTWRLETIDPTEDAEAFITFVDCAGNDTTLQITYNAPDIKLVDKNVDFGRHSVGDKSWKQMHLINFGTGDWVLNYLSLKLKDLLNNPQGFTIWNEQKTGPVALPVTIPAGDSLHFWIQFDATVEGTFWDSVGYGDTCFFFYKSYVEANVGMPIIDVSDWSFPATNVGSPSYGQFDVKNIGSVDLEITGYEGPFVDGKKVVAKIYSAKDLEELNISETNPLVLAPGKTVGFALKFTPDDTISYPDEIRFISNTIKTYPVGDPTLVDSVCLLSGRGLQSDLIATSYNWERKRIHRTAFPAGPYPATINAINADTCIKLYNGGNTPVTITKMNDITKTGDVTAFKFNKADLLNKEIAGNDSLIVQVEFQPTATGNHVYTFEFETNNPLITGVQTTLQGVGIVPRITTTNYDFGKTIINDFNHFSEQTVVITNQSVADWQFGDSVKIDDITLTNIRPEIIQAWDQFTEPFRLDKDPIALPFSIWLQPGETLEIPVDFVARVAALANASITTISDAEAEQTSNLTGAGLTPNSTIAGDQTLVCVGMIDSLNIDFNNNGETNVTIGAIDLSNTTQFTFINPAEATGFNLIPGESKTVKIKYSGSIAGIQNCIVTTESTPYLTIPAENAGWTIPLTVDLQGQAVDYTRQIEIAPKTNSTNVKIDNYFTKQVNLLPGDDLQSAKVIGLSVKVELNGDFLMIKHFDKDEPRNIYRVLDTDKDGIVLGSLFNNYPAGAFSIKNLLYVGNKNDKGTLTFEIMRNAGFGNEYITSPNGGELLGLTIGTFLPKQNTTTSSDLVVTVTPIEEDGQCVDIPLTTDNISIDKTCVFDIRKIVFSGGNFYLSSIKPNPVVGDEAVIEFEVANVDCQTRIEVYNSANQLVATPVDKIMQPGRYEVVVPVNTWSSGSYYYIMKAGPYEEQRRMIITK